MCRLPASACYFHSISPGKCGAKPNTTAYVCFFSTDKGSLTLQASPTFGSVQLSLLAFELANPMAPKVDSAILEALGLDAKSSKIAAHGGSGFASTFKLSGQVDGKEVNYFVKTGTGTDAEIMFRGQPTSPPAAY